MNLTIIESRLPIKIGVVVEGFSEEITTLLKKWAAPFWDIDYSTNYITILTIVPISTDNEVICKNDMCYVGSYNSVAQIVNTIIHHTRITFKLYAMQYGFVNLHSACIVHNDVGILIDAPRNSGKTTVLLEALSTNNFSLVANDQVMLNYKNMLAYGYPATIGIRASTLSHSLQSKIIWYEDDSFFGNKKPIIHITDIASEFNATIYSQIQIKLLINYSKANDYNELRIETNFVDSQEILKSIELPLANAYGNRFMKFYMDLVNKTTPTSHYEAQQSQPKIMLFKVSCGKNQIINLLDKIKDFITELSKNMSN